MPTYEYNAAPAPTVRGPPEHHGLSAQAVPALRETVDRLISAGAGIPLQGFRFLFHRLSLHTLFGRRRKGQG